MPGTKPLSSEASKTTALACGYVSLDSGYVGADFFDRFVESRLVAGRDKDLGALGDEALGICKAGAAGTAELAHDFPRILLRVARSRSGWRSSIAGLIPAGSALLSLFMRDRRGGFAFRWWRGRCWCAGRRRGLLSGARWLLRCGRVWQGSERTSGSQGRSRGCGG